MTYFNEYCNELTNIKAMVECAGCGKMSEPCFGIPEGWSFIWDVDKVKNLSGGVYINRLEYCPNCAVLIEALE